MITRTGLIAQGIIGGADRRHSQKAKQKKAKFNSNDFEFYLKDTRPEDQWGFKIGKSYANKKWRELTSEEMAADFNFKNDILESYSEERVSPETFYEWLFGDLCDEEISKDFKIVMIDYNAESKKISKLDIQDIYDYFDYDGVALSPCLFYQNWKRKDLLKYVCAFVLDIDELRPLQLQRFFKLFEEKRILTPSFIANSGRGVHFYYVLDHFVQVDKKFHSTNLYLCEQIYKKLYDDIIIKEKYELAQRHWIGQDYRVVGSLSRLHQQTTAWRTGKIYSFDELIEYFNLTDDRKKNIATPRQQAYAKSIAKDLNLQLDDELLNNANNLYNFIAEHKDEAYEARVKKREIRKEKRKNKKPGSWYKNVYRGLFDGVQSGFRFSSLKALAIIAIKDKIDRDVFLKDLENLTSYWKHKDWGEDDFNVSNVEAIVRLYDNGLKYANTSSETLESWLGFDFKHIPEKRNGRTREEHIKLMNFVRDEINQNANWREGNGRPDKKAIVQKWREENPNGTKYQCTKETGLSKNTVKKWWNPPASEN